VLVAVMALAAGVLIIAPRVTGPSLPAGATRLLISTEGPVPPMGCATALLVPVRVAAQGDSLVLVAVESGEVVPVVWPSGFAAWRADGTAVVVGPYGNVIAREGDVRDDLSGGDGTDDAFHICPYGITDAGG
jgi:hypothetical protein